MTYGFSFCLPLLRPIDTLASQMLYRTMVNPDSMQGPKTQALVHLRQPS